MSGRNSDVQLVIRARDEAQKTIDSVSGALTKLFGIQNKVSGSAEETGQNIGQLASILGTLDKAYSSIAGATERAETAFNRQKAAISGQKAELQALQAQATAAAGALERLNSGDAIVNAGRDQSGRLSQLKVVQAEYDRLSTQIDKLARSIATQEVGLNSSVSSLQRLGSAANAMEAAVAGGRREIEQTTRALREQASAAETAANVQRVTGVGRSAATDNGAGFEALAHREIQLQRDREQAAREAAAAVALSVRQSVGLGSGRATDNGATFQALAAREEAAALKEAGIAHQMFENRVRQGVTAMEEAARAERASADAVERLRAQLNPVAAEEARLTVEQGKLNSLFKQGKISADELSAGMKLLRGNADNAIKAVNGQNGLDSHGRPSLFGLRSYELTNLGYQINDVVTQLASGTSLAQTLGQQGGQILQLFPRVGAAIVGALASGPFLAAGAALTGIVLILKDAFDRAERIRQFGGLLTLAAGSGSDATAKGLNAATEALDHYGLSAEKAVAVVRALMKEGFDEDQIVKFGKAAQDMADVLGIDVVEAAKQIGTAFNGGYESILKLGKATDAYTAAEYARIKALFDAGKAEDARSLASSIFVKRQDEAAQKAVGPWTHAARTFGDAWDTALAGLANSKPVQSLGGFFDDLANSVNKAVNALKNMDESDWVNALAKLNNKLSFGVSDAINRQVGLPTSTGPEFPNSLTGGKATGINPAVFKQQPPAAPATPTYNAAATAAVSKAADEAEREARAQAEVTSEIEIQNRLRDLRIKLREQAQEQFGRGADPKVVDRFVNAGVDQEKIKLEKQLTEYKERQKNAAEAAARADEQALRAYVQRVVKAENSSGRADARNPNSTATGNGQFIESTWLNLFRKYFPQEAENMGRDAILELRKNADVSAKLIELYARENAAALQKSGQAVTEANLQLAHFLGAEGAVKVLKSAAGTKIADLFTSAKEKQAIAANPTILGNGATRESVLAYADRRAGGTGNGNVGSTVQTAMEGEAALRKIEQDRLDAQDKFNAKVDDENEKRKLGIDSMQSQLGLVGEALLAKQREQVINEAVLAKQQEIDKLNADRTAKGLPELEFTDKQRQEIIKTTAAYFDLAHAREAATAKADAVQRPVDDLTAQRDAIQAQMDFLRNQGLADAANQLQPSLDAINGQLDTAIQKAIEFYRNLDLVNDPLGRTQAQIDAIITRLETAQAGTAQWVNILGVSGQQIAQVFANQATNALDKFAQAVAEGKNVFSSLKDAFLSFAADFLQMIAQMIIQAIIFNIVASFLRAAGGSAAGGAGAAPSAGSLPSSYGINPSFAHTGGVVGETALLSKPVSPAWFVNAQRYHGGGIAGLRPDEVPAVLQRGEEVLTASDPRHRANGGLSGDGQNINIVNSFDPDEAAQAILNTPAGEKALLNLVTRNRRAFQNAMGG